MPDSEGSVGRARQRGPGIRPLNLVDFRLVESLAFLPCPSHAALQRREGGARQPSICATPCRELTDAVMFVQNDLVFSPQYWRGGADLLRPTATCF